MTDVILDTSRYVDVVNGNPVPVSALRGAGVIRVPLIVMAELRGGFLNGGFPAANERRLQLFLAEPGVEVLHLDDATTLEYAEIYAPLKKANQLIPTNDLFIAALARQHGLPLFANDQHFRRVPGLRLL